MEHQWVDNDARKESQQEDATQKSQGIGDFGREQEEERQRNQEGDSHGVCTEQLFANMNIQKEMENVEPNH